MGDPLITEILELGQTLGANRMALPGEGSLGARMSESRLAVTRRGANLERLQATDLVHLDGERLAAVIAQDPVLPEDIAGTQLHAEGGSAAHEDAALFTYMLGLDANLQAAAHIHPVAIDQITASPRARQFADRRTLHHEVLALGSALLLVNYADPGMPLLREIEKKMVLWRDRHKSVPRVVLVQNHGAFVLAENAPALWRHVQSLMKYADVFIGASLLGGPVFLTPQAITQIELNHRGKD